MIRELDKLSPKELGEAHQATEALLSGKLRPYIPGHMLPVLLSRFHDDIRDMLGLEPGQYLPARDKRQPDMLTDTELGTLAESVGILLDKFTGAMDDPALPALLDDYRALLASERQDRAKIRAVFGKGQASAS